jgi:hypothetical protein
MTNSELQKSIAALPFDLDDGMLIWPRDGGYYVSDAPPRAGVWARLRREQPRSGLWPVFLQCHAATLDNRWDEGMVGFRRSDRPQRHSDYDAEAVLAKQWAKINNPTSTSPDEVAEYAARTAPFDLFWPGLAPEIESRRPPDEVADEFAGRLVNDSFTRMGLVQVDRGADVPRATGWYAGEDISPGKATAVLRSWEDRFGTRLIQIGFNTMILSVAAPPTSLAVAQQVAVEHLAFCDENIEDADGALTRYAKELIGIHHWSFWWYRNTGGWFC